MTYKENYLKTVRFEYPEYIPMRFMINDACWAHYPHGWLEEQMAEHPLLFPAFRKLNKQKKPLFNTCARKDEPYLDDWGCTWETLEDGITGTVTKHPLASWDSFPDYIPPDPEKVCGVGEVNWKDIEKIFRRNRENGKLNSGGLTHGHTFLRLCDIRGYENVLFDMYDKEPRFIRLMEIVEDFNLKFINNLVKYGADVISYAEDLGMQVGPMISPELFDTYIKPIYTRIIKPARESGAIIHMHSDGDIRSLTDSLIEGGVEILNLQDLVNGVDWIKDTLTGKICIDLDIDRQDITPFGSPKQIKEYIHSTIKQLGSKQGGLMLVYGLYPGVPRENVTALMDVLEQNYYV